MVRRLLKVAPMRWVLPLGLTIVCSSTSALAQTTTLFTPVVPTADILQLNREEIEKNSVIELQFTSRTPPIAVGMTYQYELRRIPGGILGKVGGNVADASTVLDVGVSTSDLDGGTSVDSGTLVDSGGVGNAIVTGSMASGTMPSGGQTVKFMIHVQDYVSPDFLNYESVEVDGGSFSILVCVFATGQSCTLDENGNDTTNNNNNGGSGNVTQETYRWTFKFDTKRPPAPEISEVRTGENRLTVYWSPPSETTDVGSYEIGWCKTSTTGENASPTRTFDERCPNAEERRVEKVDKAQVQFGINDDVENGIPTAVAVRSVDPVSNAGKWSAAAIESPVEVADFFELYTEQGGNEDGGFCFIATAAYGSYAHPTVRVFRLFRDVVLKWMPGGPTLIDAYYALSPPLAARIRADSSLATAARLLLLPLAVLAIVILASPLLGAAAVAFHWVRRGRRRRKHRRAHAIIAGILGGLVVIALAVPSFAERPKQTTGWTGVGFELKGGPYLPAIGTPDEAGAQQTFIDVFKKADTGLVSKRALFTLGLDLQLFRAFGSAGVGGSFGFMQWVGVGQDRDPPAPHPGETNVFNLAPLSLAAFYRFDWLADHSPIPLVPYARFGLAYHLWWVTVGNGDIAEAEHVVRDENGDPMVVDGVPVTERRDGKGGKLGWTGTLGIAFLLNAIDPSSARNLYEATTIRGTYIFFEYQTSKVDGFGDSGFDLSDDTWNLGLYLEI